MSSLWPVEPSGDFCIQQFRKSSLVKWALTFANQDVDRDLESQGNICSVEFLKDILREIVSQAQTPQISESDNSVLWHEDPVLQRLSVLEWIVTNLRTYFMDVLGQIMIMRCPDILFMSQFPDADHSAKEMRKLLLLILGFAVQSGRKEQIIERIQSMEEDAQKDIVECIKEVTDNPELVELSDHNVVEGEEPGVLRVTRQHVKSLLRDRETLIKFALSLWREKREVQHNTLSDLHKRPLPNSSHHSVEIADHKAQIRRITQELYDVGEELKDCKEELKTAYSALDVLKNENTELNKECGLAKVYRDELDVLYEKEKHSFKLEAELSRCRGQLVELEYHKNRIEELEQNLQLLNDTKNLLEAQLESVRKRTELIPQLEKDLSLVRSNLQNALLDNNAQSDQLKDLAIKNTQLSLELQRFRRRSNEEGPVDGEDHTDPENQQNGLSLSDQLQESLLSKVLRLEGENEKLTAVLKGGDYYNATCRHCSEKDSAVSTLHTEDAFSSSSSAETDRDRHLEDNSDHASHEFLNFIPDKLSTQPRVSEDSDVSYLKEQNAYLKAEVSALRGTIQQYEKLEVKLAESRHNEVLAKRQLYEAEEKIRDLTEQQRVDENEKIKANKLQDEIMLLRIEKERRDSESLLLQEEHRSSEQELKRLNRVCQNKELALVELQKTLDEVETSLLAARERVLEYSVTAEKVAVLENRQSELTQEAAVATSKVAQLDDELRRQQHQSTKERQCLDQVTDFLHQTGVVFPENFDRLEGAEKGTALSDMVCEVIARSEQQALATSHNVIRSELESLRREHDLLKRNHEQDVLRLRGNPSGPSSISIEATCTSVELEKVRTLETEVESLKRKLSETSSLLSSARLQEERSTAAKRTLQTDCNHLESENTSLRAEVRSFQSQNNDLKTKLKSQEKKAETLIKTMERSQETYSSVMADHEALQRFHGELNEVYEKLVKEFGITKSNNKKLILDLDIARQEVAKAERDAAERPRRDSDRVRLERLQRLEKEYENLQTENEVLRKNNRKLGDSYRVLTETTQVQTTEINQLKLEKIEYEGVVYDCKNQVQHKEIEADKHTEILLGIIAALEDDKRSIATAMERLISQYDEIFALSWKEKNQMQSEKKEMHDKLQALNTQKELLIQKLYDTFKSTEARRRSVGFLKRVRRAAEELVGRSRSRSRTRGAISPSDSMADSSSVESNGGSEQKRNSMHPKSLYSLKSSKNLARESLPSSYSSDDLRKQSSSASSACISPTEMSTANRSVDMADGRTPSVTPQDGAKRLSSSSDMASFHRVGSRRGVYEPSHYATVVVHHKALSPQTPLTAQAPPNSKLDKKNCCTSYGGFHDCSMMNHARLSTTSALSNNSPTPSILRNGAPDSPEKRLAKMQPSSPLNGMSSPGLDELNKRAIRTPTISRMSSVSDSNREQVTPTRSITTPADLHIPSTPSQQGSVVYAARRYLTPTGNSVNSPLVASSPVKTMDGNTEAWFEYGCV